MTTPTHDFFVSYFPDKPTKQMALDIQYYLIYSLYQRVSIKANPNGQNPSMRPNSEILSRLPFVAFLIGPHFLTSRICMEELAIVAMDPNFRNRSMVVVMPRFQFRRAAVVKVKAHWENELRELKATIAELSAQGIEIKESQAELEKVEFILANAPRALGNLMPHRVVHLGKPDARKITHLVAHWIHSKNPQPQRKKTIERQLPKPLLGPAEGGKFPFQLQKLIDDMVPVTGGTFMMGDSSQPKYTFLKLHEVRLPEFKIGRYPVTQLQWEAVMNFNPGWYIDDRNRPVVNVSWHDCQHFIQCLNTLLGTQFRLPTEAEWEFAARGGNLSKGNRYAGSSDPLRVAWYRANSKRMPHPVGMLQPNELGLYDMNGNVWEWCEDGYERAYYDNSAIWNPKGNPSSRTRVQRGGSWYVINAALWDREHSKPEFKNGKIGLRLAMDA